MESKRKSRISAIECHVFVTFVYDSAQCSTDPLRLFSPPAVHIMLQSDHIVVLGFVTI